VATFMEEGFAGLAGGSPLSSWTPAHRLRPTSAPRWSAWSVAGVPAAFVGACSCRLCVGASLWVPSSLPLCPFLWLLLQPLYRPAAWQWIAMRCADAAEDLFGRCYSHGDDKHVISLKLILCACGAAARPAHGHGRHVRPGLMGLHR
jgi:hypothetical protein